jgi:hypothetical protein
VALPGPCLGASLDAPRLARQFRAWLERQPTAAHPTCRSDCARLVYASCFCFSKLASARLFSSSLLG